MLAPHTAVGGRRRGLGPGKGASLTGKRPECMKQVALNCAGPGGFEKLLPRLASVTEIVDYLPNHPLSNLPLFIFNQTPFCLEQLCAKLRTLTFPHSLAANGGNVTRSRPMSCERCLLGFGGQPLLPATGSSPFPFPFFLSCRCSVSIATTGQQAQRKSAPSEVSP